MLYAPYGNELSTDQCRLLLLWDELRISHKEQKQVYGDEQGDALPTKNTIFRFILSSIPDTLDITYTSIYPG